MRKNHIGMMKRVGSRGSDFMFEDQLDFLTLVRRGTYNVKLRIKYKCPKCLF